MPSLNALKEFKSSFYDIANERKDVSLKDLPLDDLELPDIEPPPFDPRKDDPPSFNSEPAEDFNFGAFLDDISADTPPSLDDLLGSLGSDSADTPADTQSDDVNLDDFLSGLGNEPADTPPDDANLDDFFNGLGSEPASMEDASSADQDDGVSEESEGAFPEDLLAGFSNEMESASDDFQSDDVQSDEFQSDDFQTSDFQSEEEPSSFGFEDDFPTDDFDDEDSQEYSAETQGIDLGGEDLNIDYSAPDESDAEDFDFPGMEQPEIPETFDDDTDTSSGGIDLGGESSDFKFEEEINGNEDFSMDDILPDTGSFDGETSSSETDDFLGDLDFPGEDTSAADDFDGTLDGVDFPVDDDSGLPGTDDFDDSLGSITEDADFTGFEQTGDASASEHEFGDLGSDFSSDSIDLGDSTEPESLGGEDFGHEAFGSDDFEIPGLEEIFEKTKTETKFEPVKKKGFFGRKKKKAEDLPDAEEGIEEISLSQEDVDSLLKTLATYPLNLRIVCQELIAEQVLLPKQLTKLIRLLVTGAHVKETAAHVEEITGKPVVIPKSFEKSTGAAFEAEQSSFAYIFVNNFLPVLRLFAVIAVLAASVVYLSYQFIYKPLRAEGLYQRGYERIFAGEYQRANDLFHQAFTIHRNKKWFYAYAEAFRDRRRFMLAEGKYDELLRFYPRDKKGVLDYAYLNTYYIMNFEKANRLLQQNILDFAPNDFEALLAAGDNFLAWADSDPSRFSARYEDARFAYARLLEIYGWRVPIVERMLKYFIRTDDLREVLQIRVWFENDTRRRLSTETLAELGGYLLDKQLETPRGVPNPYVESIESVRAMLLQAVRENRYLPEPHYHLARYHHSLGNTYEERLTLENAIRAFDLARTETVRRRLTRVDTHFRYANLLVSNREFFPAETQLVRGIELYEEYMSRNLIRATPQLGQLYAARGDLEFYTKTGDRQAADNALRDYRAAERFGHAPPEMLYRMGAAFYQLEDWGNSLSYLFRASTDMPLNRRLLFALGNVTYQRGDYFAAQGYFDRLLDTLESQRIRLPTLLPSDNPQFLELGERLMMARNNAGVVYEALAEQTGNREFRNRALALYSESARAWDSITRNPNTMTRMSLVDIPGAPSINLGYLNAANALRASTENRPQIFVRIDRDGLEPSRWEQLAPFGER
jgi:tetratricopeptide (TPR) repeat protein